MPISYDCEPTSVARVWQLEPEARSRDSAATRSPDGSPRAGSRPASSSGGKWAHKGAGRTRGNRCLSTACPRSRPRGGVAMVSWVADRGCSISRVWEQRKQEVSSRNDSMKMNSTRSRTGGVTSWKWKYESYTVLLNFVQFAKKNEKTATSFVFSSLVETIWSIIRRIKIYCIMTDNITEEIQYQISVF